MTLGLKDEAGGASCYRVTKTVILALGRVFMGLYLELAGPSLTDLQGRLGVSYEPISQALAARSAGYFVGAIVGGLLLDKFPSKADLLLMFAFLFGGVGTIAVPWGRSVTAVGVVMHLQGIGQGMIDTGADTSMFRLWGGKAAAPICAMHFGFGIGAFSAPFLARSFLAPDLQQEERNNSCVRQGNETAKAIDYWSDSQIEVPYGIAGALTCCMAVVMLVFFLAKPPRGISFEQPGRTFTQLFSPGSCAQGKIGFGVQMFVVIFLFYMNVVGGERAYGKFISSFSRDMLSFSRDQATYLNSVFWGSFLAARGLAVLIFPFLPPTLILLLLCLLTVATALVLVLFAHSNALLLWVFSGVFGFLLAPTFPAGQAWANQYMQLKGMAVAVMYIGSACGGFLYQWLTGHVLDTFGMRSLMRIILGYSCALTVISIVGVVVTRGWRHMCRRPKIERKSEQVSDSSDWSEKDNKI